MALQTVTTSKQYSLNLNDWWKGLIMAVGGAVYQIIVSTIQSGSLTFDWEKIGLLALGALVIYIGKNFFTPGKIVVSGASDATIAAVKDGAIDVKVGTTTATVVANVPPNNP